MGAHANRSTSRLGFVIVLLGAVLFSCGGGGARSLRTVPSAPLSSVAAQKEVAPKRSGLRVVFQQRHTNSIKAFAASADEKLSATSSDDATIRIWDNERGMVIDTIPTKGVASGALAFSPDGKQLAFTLFDRIHLWDISEQKEVFVASSGPPDVEESYRNGGLAFEKTGAQLFVHRFDGSFSKQSAKTGQLEGTWSVDGHGTASDAKIKIRGSSSQSQSQIISCSTDDSTRTPGKGRASQVTIWNATTGKVDKHLGEATDNCRVLALAAGESQLLVVDQADGGTARLWDLEQNKVLASFKAGGGSGKAKVTAAAFAREGREVFTATDDGALYWWHASGRLIKKAFSAQTAMNHLASLADGSVLVVGGWSIGKVEPNEGTLTDFGAFSAGPLLDVQFSNDGKRIYTHNNAGLVREWDLDLAAQGRALNPVDTRIEQYSLLADRTRAVGQVSKISKRPGGSSSSSSPPPSSSSSSPTAAKTESKKIVEWNLKTLQQVTRSSADFGKSKALLFSPDGTWALVEDSPVTLPIPPPFPNWPAPQQFKFRLVDAQTGKTKVKLEDLKPKDTITRAFLSPDGSSIAGVLETSDRVTFWDTATGKIQRTITRPTMPEGMPALEARQAVGPMCTGFSGHPEMSNCFVAAFAFVNNQLAIAVHQRPQTNAVSMMTFAPNPSEGPQKTPTPTPNLWGWMERPSSALVLWDLQTGKQKQHFGNRESTVSSLALSNDKKLVAIGEVDGTVRVLDLASGAVSYEVRTHSGRVSAVQFSPDGSRLATASWDGQLHVHVLKTKRSVAFFADREMWLVVDNEGYFDGSTDAGWVIAAVEGQTAFSIDQIAAHRNRPDKILATLGMVSQDVIDRFARLNDRRMRRLNLTPDASIERFDDAPRARIVELTNKRATGTLTVELTQRKHPLARYQIYANGTPLFEQPGKVVPPPPSPTPTPTPTPTPSSSDGNAVKVTVTEEVALLPAGAINILEVAAIDNRGVESLRASKRIVLKDEPWAGGLYFIAFGVSKYADSRLDLAYAHKDAADLEALFKQMPFPWVKTHLFTDAKATRANVISAQGLLYQAKPEDTVVVFVAGHGVHLRDDTGEYFYVTHDAKPSNLRDTAASFDIFERLFASVPSRRKLFLMDTCESGESDETAPATSSASAPSSTGQRGITARSTRGLKLDLGGGKESQASQGPSVAINIFSDRRRMFFNDLSRRTGTVVLSSSRGSELSYELDELKNGAFTAELKAALTSRVATDDKSEYVNTDDLRDYLSTTVARRTNDKQHPTIDRDNALSPLMLPLLLKKR